MTTEPERTDENEAPFRMLRRDARLLIGALAVLCGDMMYEPRSSVSARVRNRLARDGALADASSVGEAALVVSDLIQQVRYICGEYEGDERPEPIARVTGHFLDMPDTESAEACAAEVSALGPIGTQIMARDGGRCDLLVGFPELSPDAAYEVRSTELATIASRHGGRRSGSAPGWC